MKQKYSFVGQMPILFTSVHSDGSIDIESQNRLTDLLISCEPAALGHLGGASEYHKISDKDRDIIISALVERVNKKYPVFIGNTALSFRQSIDNAKRAEELGADLLMTCSPIFGKVSQNQLYDYYKALCDAVSIPIIVQDTGASSAAYTPEFMAKLAELPNVGYAKCEGDNFYTYSDRLIKAAGDKVQIIGGAGGRGMMQLLGLGITAFMTGTEAPEIHSGVIMAYVKGKKDLAEKIYNDCVAPYLFLYGLKPKTTAIHHLNLRGIFAETNMQWPNEETNVDSKLIDEFERVMAQCRAKFAEYKDQI